MAFLSNLITDLVLLVRNRKSVMNLINKLVVLEQILESIVNLITNLIVLVQNRESVMVEVAKGGNLKEALPVVVRFPKLVRAKFQVCVASKFSILGLGDILAPGIHSLPHLSPSPGVAYSATRNPKAARVPKHSHAGIAQAITRVLLFAGALRCSEKHEAWYILNYIRKKEC
ncbi:hypothetical protein HPB48_022656 [Haemaphysalis longicornis]|uniref:Uncharacterized protein n=1 Tax=Haemaphysalis longicornis TaxID=44386 RepID=A0A9J6GRZ0_HAELO|nr:hypothetical protein HPB48_022656 [Haemaphysalis longicornis]